MRILKWIISLFLLLILLLIIGFTSVINKNNMPTSKPKDFNFVFDYGVDAKNKLDTVNGKYTKDMISDPAVTINLKLTDKEMDDVYSKMRKINILSYSDNFHPWGFVHHTPFYTYRIKIIIDGKEKIISWDDESSSRTKHAKQLRDLFNQIEEIVTNKNEFKELPPAQGGYQ
jgi:hypothetical protein